MAVIGLPLGYLAVGRGWVTRESLRAVLIEQQRQTGTGKRPLGEMLVNHKLLSAAQLQELLAAQGPEYAEQKKLACEALIGHAKIAGCGKTALAMWMPIRWLGAGAEKDAYLLFEAKHERPVVLKQLRLQTDETAEKQRIRAVRFVTEAQMLGSLAETHAGISKILQSRFDAPSGPFYTEPFYAKTLRDWLDERVANTSRRHRLDVFFRLLDAVAFLHAKNIIHRDLKPENIMMDGDQPILVDFGAAISRNIQPLYAVGTITYMPPEAFRAGPTAPTLDVFALGVILDQMITGRATPFSRSVFTADEHTVTSDRARLETQRRRYAPDRALRNNWRDTWRGEMPGELNAIIAKALNPDPAARYATVTALRDDLLAHVKHAPTTAYRATAVERAARFAYRQPWWSASIVTLPIIAVAATAWLYSQAQLGEQSEAITQQGATIDRLHGELGGKVRDTASELRDEFKRLYSALRENYPDVKAQVELFSRISDEHIERYIGAFTELFEARQRPEIAASAVPTAEDYFFYGDLMRFARRDYPAALAAYSRAIELDPKYAEARLHRADVRYFMREYETALAEYDALIAARPDYVLAYLRRAITAAEMGDFVAALESCDRAVELAPNYAWAWGNRGSLRIKMADRAPNGEPTDFTAALDDLNRAIKLDARISEFFNSRAEIHRRQGRHAAAIDDYTLAIGVNPRMTTAFINRGVAHHALGNYEAALSDFSAALKLDETNVIALKGQSQALFRLGRFDEALFAIDAAIALDPNFAALYVDRGNAVAAQDQRQAIAEYGRAIALDSKYGAAWFNRGESRRAIGDIDGAIADLTTAIDLGYSLGESLMQRGFAYVDAKKFALAHADLTHAIERGAAADWRAHFGLGLARRGLNDRAGAEVAYSQGIDTLATVGNSLTARAEEFEVFYNRGLLRADRGDSAGAETDFTAAIDRNPQMYLGFYQRGEARRLQGKLDEAIADFNDALRLAPGHPFSLFRRGRTWCELERWEDALSDLNAAMTREPNRWYIHFFRGLANRKLGHHRVAIADFTTGIALNETHPDIYVARAGVYLDVDDRTAALRDLTRAIELDSSHIEARINRSGLYLEMDEPELAAADCRAVNANSPSHWQAWAHLGIAYHRMGKTGDARAAYDHAIRISPPADRDRLIANRAKNIGE